jgi:DNA-binding NarL/FixJ family response regulator
MQHFSGYGFRAMIGQKEAKRQETREPAPRDVVALIDSRPLMRASVELLLENWTAEFCVVPFNAADDFMAGIGQDGDLIAVVLLNIGHDDLACPALQATVRRLTQREPSAPVVILSDRDTRDQILEAFRLGARGYIPTSTEPRLAIEAVRLVQAGGTFIPPKLLDTGLDLGQTPPSVVLAPPAPTSPPTPPALQAPPASAEDAPAGGDGELVPRLTLRQRQVLSLLREGKQNKIIAYQLDMRESTVKVHVRQIMKKLHARNRTEVVVRAAQLMASDPSLAADGLM